MKYILFLIFNLFENKNQFTPPITLYLKECGFYVDKTEVTNQAWAEYLIYLSNQFGKNSKEYLSALPDSNFWYSVYSSNRNALFSEYSNFPVVGISYEQAKLYCEWRSQQVNIKYKKYKTTYKLPSISEWDKIFKQTKTNTHQSMLYAYEKLGFQIYGICDNVSEMTETKGIAKGNHFLNTFDIKCDTMIQYTSIQKWLGFRCIAYVEKNGE